MSAKVAAVTVGEAVKFNMDHERLRLQNSKVYECNHLCIENIRR